MAVISKPDKATYIAALNHAELLRENENDPHSIAHTLLYLAERNHKLDTIAKAAEAYVRFGEDTQLHTNLVKALEQFEAYELEAETLDNPKFGLD